MKEDVLEVEAPLIEKQMNTIEQQLQKAVTEVNWTTTGKSESTKCSYTHTCSYMYMYTHVQLHVHVHSV